MSSGSRKQVYNFGGVAFLTKKAVLDHVRTIKDRWAVGIRVTGADDIFLRDYFAQHHEFGEKAGRGSYHFETAIWSGPGYATKGFGIRRADGLLCDISIKVTPRSKESDAKAAFRHVVDPHIKRVRATLISSVTSIGEYDIDHVYPRTFSKIIEAFLYFENMGIEDVPISNPGLQQTMPEITDLDLARRFLAFHERVAVLELVDSKLNRQFGARPRQ